MFVRQDESEATVQGTKLHLQSPARKNHRSRLRMLAFQVHRWVGAIAAIYILVMSMSGVSLVFHDELSSLLCPSPQVAVAGKRIDFSRIIENTERVYPGYKVTGLIVAKEENRPVDVFAAREGAKNVNCLVDPYSGKVLGPREKNDVLEFLRDLHHNLLSGKTGRTINGIGAVCLFTLAASGLIIWFRGAANWYKGFRFNLKGNLQKVNWNLHSTLGAWVLPMLIVWSISGFYFGFTAFFEKSLNLVFPVSAQKPLAEPDASGSDQTTKGARPNIDQLVATAMPKATGTAVLERIAFPDKRRHCTRIWLRDSQSASDDAPKTQVFLDPNTGSVLAVSRSAEPPAGDLILQWLMKLHFGTFLGTMSKTAWLFVGLTPAILSLTGLFLFATGSLRRKIKATIETTTSNANDLAP